MVRLRTLRRIPRGTTFNIRWVIQPQLLNDIFSKLLQCSPRGEFRVNGNSYDVRRFVEIGVLQTHGNVVPIAISGAGTSTATYNGNVAAIQITGFGGNARIYRR